MPDQATILSGEAVTLKQTIIGRWLGNGAYADTVKLYGSTNITMTVNSVGAVRSGDGGQTLANYRVIRDATISITWAGDLTSLAVMLGMPLSTSGVTPERIRRFLIVNNTLPYIGIAGASDLDDGSVNAVHFFAPKCKINTDAVAIYTQQGGTEAAFGTITLELNALPDEFYLDGAENCVQTLTLGTPTTGTYTLRFGQSTTAPLAYNANAASIQAALEALSEIGQGNVLVTVDGAAFDIEFVGRLAASKLPLLVATAGNTFDGTLTVTSVTEGSEGSKLIAGLFEVEAEYSPTLPPVYAVVA